MAANVGDIRPLTGTVNQVPRYINIAIPVNRPYRSYPFHYDDLTCKKEGQSMLKYLI